MVLAEGFLAEKGIYLGNIDGIFGTGMEEAVRRFQTDHLLETDWGHREEYLDRVICDIDFLKKI